jgi:hypothetical protein
LLAPNGAGKSTTTSSRLRMPPRRQLLIDAEECIDACVEACPVDACFAEDQLPEEWAHYAKLNANYYYTSKT